MPSFHSYATIYISFFFGLICAIFPLPIILSAFRPDWMILLIFYWVLALPQRVSITHACILGLLLDLLLGSILGLHSLLFAILAYAISINYQRIRYFTLVQTTLLVGLFILASKLSLYFINFHVLNTTLEYSIFLRFYYLSIAQAHPNKISQTSSYK